jgi:hypothetical protein
MKKILILIICFSLISCNRYNKSVFKENCHTSNKEIKFMEKQRLKQYEKIQR